MMLSMWVYLETWMVKDGALPELARAAHLRGVGLRADCHNVAPVRTATDGIAKFVDPGGEQGSGSYRYELTGMAGPATDVWSGQGHVGSEFVITTGDQAFLARTTGPASEVAAGSRVTAQCTLNVVADYEWDAFYLPDLRTDWYVRRLKIEHRQIEYAPAGPGGARVGYPGKVLRAFEIECMSRWDDDRDTGIVARYLLDVTPLRAS
jgi:hypothetical protein